MLTTDLILIEEASELRVAICGLLNEGFEGLMVEDSNVKEYFG